MANLSLAETIRSLIAADKVSPADAGHRAPGPRTIAVSPIDGEELARLVERDPALVCNLLRAANSSFFWA